jgi:hypothetical protein
MSYALYGATSFNQFLCWDRSASPEMTSIFNDSGCPAGDCWGAPKAGGSGCGKKAK